MKSITEIFNITYGPNSLLNSAAYNASCFFCINFKKYLEENKKTYGHIEVNLYNELARLNKQSKTNEDIETAFDESDMKVTVNTDKKVPDGDNHPLRFDFLIYGKDNNLLKTFKCYSIGGGFFDFEGYKQKETYPFKTWAELEEYFDEHPMTYIDFCSQYEDRLWIINVLQRAVGIMDGLIASGLTKRGRLKLDYMNINYARRAWKVYEGKSSTENADERLIRKVSAYTYAIAEEITGKCLLSSAPSIGSCAAYWGVLRYIRENYEVSEDALMNAICAAGLVCGMMMQNGTVSSNVGGCQAEMGAAAAMTAASMAVIMNNADPHEVGRAAEMAVEHSLGLICNTVCALPIVPCIQRAAAFGLRGLECAILNESLMKTPELVKFDDIIKVLSETGADLLEKNRTVGNAGFAKDAAYSIVKGIDNTRAWMFKDLDLGTPDQQRTSKTTGEVWFVNTDNKPDRKDK